MSVCLYWNLLVVSCKRSSRKAGPLERYHHLLVTCPTNLTNARRNVWLASEIRGDSSTGFCVANILPRCLFFFVVKQLHLVYFTLLYIVLQTYIFLVTASCPNLVLFSIYVLDHIFKIKYLILPACLNYTLCLLFCLLIYPSRTIELISDEFVSIAGSRRPDGEDIGNNEDVLLSCKTE